MIRTKSMSYPAQYWFIDKFVKSADPRYKYVAIIRNKLNHTSTAEIPFGDIDTPHYKDRVLGLYTEYDTLDEELRDNYRSWARQHLKYEFFDQLCEIELCVNYLYS